MATATKTTDKKEPPVPATTTTTLVAVVRALSEAIGGAAPIHQALVFLIAAQGDREDGGLEVREIGHLAGLSSASTSRSLAAIGDWHRLQRPGRKLVKLKTDMADRRRKTVHLTEQGKRLLADIASSLK